MRKMIAGVIMSLIFMAMVSLGAAPECAATEVEVLHMFEGGSTDGAGPYGTPTLSADGSTLYGMTTAGGATNKGTIYSMSSSGGDTTVIHSFTWGMDETGDKSLTLIGSKLYGMTYGGGASNAGNIFSLDTANNTYTDLHSFGGAGDGAYSYGNITLGADGNTLYGMTVNGGDSNVGTIFSIGKDGSGYSKLYSFAGGAGDGSNPRGSLTLGPDGKLYGMTNTGGDNNFGTIFSIDTDGTDYAILHEFSSGITDGKWPFGSLTLGPGGKLYGTTAAGGSESEGGTIFTMATDGSDFYLLHTFYGGAGDGWTPYGTLTLGADGLLYGTAVNRGPNYPGALFSIDANGTYNMLWPFTGDDGYGPHGSLALSADGSTLYGMTPGGGSNNQGVVFRYGTGYQAQGPGGGATPEPATILGALGALAAFGVRRLRSRNKAIA